MSSMQIEEMAKSVLGLYQKAIASADLLLSDREDLSARACTFADLCGSAAMQEAAERLHAARSAPFLVLFKLCLDPSMCFHMREFAGPELPILTSIPEGCSLSGQCQTVALIYSCDLTSQSS